MTYLPVQKNGLVSLEDFKNSLTPQTVLASIMFVNNEIGVVQPIEQMGKLCWDKGVFFHSDIA